MGKRIAIIQGHPDAGTEHFCHALAAAYAAGAQGAGHEVRRIDVATLDFPVLRSQQAFLHEAPVDAIRAAQETIRWSEHVVILHPLWLGMMPALLKAFLEQVLRPDYAFAAEKGFPKALLKGRSARVVVTMGMPAIVYRWFFGAHGLRALERSILRFCGFKPVADTLIGGVESSPAVRDRWLGKLQALGRAAG